MKKEIQAIIPLRDQIILKMRQPEQSKGFIIPPSGKESREPGIAEVIAIGDGNLENGDKATIPFNVGDIVIYNSWSSIDLSIIDPTSEEKYISVSAKDILLKFKGAK